MKSSCPLPSFRSALAAGLFFAAFTLTLRATDHPPTAAPAGVLAPVSAKIDLTWLAQARAAYPLDRCPVCDDKLDGKSPDYVYQQPGKPDRLVRFCGDDECVPKFKQEPARYLKAIDDAAAVKPAVAKK